MKKILLVLASVYSSLTFGQGKLFLQPQLGVGIANSVQSPTFATKFEMVFDGLLGIVYQRKHLVVHTGIGYLRSGNRQDITYTDFNGNVIGVVKQYNYFNHVVIPLTVGHQFNTRKKMNITLGAGPAFTYNLSLQQKLVGMSTQRKTISSDAFDKVFSRFSVWGVVQANFQYPVSKGMWFVFMPQFNYMVTDIMKSSYKEHNYTLMLNLGVKLDLGKQQAKK